MSGVVEFTTETVRAQDRTAYWRDEVWRNLGPFDVRGGERGMVAKVRFRPLGILRIGSVESHAHSICRSPADLRGEERDMFKVVVQRSGWLRLEQNGQRIVLNAGEWAIYNPFRPFRFECSDGTTQSTIFLRAEDLRVRSLAPYAMRRFSGAGGYSRLFTAALATALGLIDDHCSLADIDTMLSRLARLSLMEHGDMEARRSSRDIMLERIEAYLDQHLRRPDLTIHSIAAALNCSKRYLHKVFLDSGETLSEHVLRRRLEACRLELIDNASSHLSVTEIAYAWGFNSLPYFSRVFKAAHGMGPRDYRALYMQGDPLKMPVGQLRFRRH